MKVISCFERRINVIRWKSSQDFRCGHKSAVDINTFTPNVPEEGNQPLKIENHFHIKLKWTFKFLEIFLKNFIEWPHSRSSSCSLLRQVGSRGQLNDSFPLPPLDGVEGPSSKTTSSVRCCWAWKSLAARFGHFISFKATRRQIRQDHGQSFAPRWTVGRR